MLSNFYSAPSVLNENYHPLELENATFLAYLTDLFCMLDNKVNQEDKLLLALIDKYLSYYSLSSMYTGRVIQQRELATQIKIILQNTNDFATPKQRIDKAFNQLNQFQNAINASDDFFGLLSAYCSLIPSAYQALTNQQMKNILTIRDVNNIYFHTILKKHMDSVLAKPLDSFTDTEIEIALVTGKLEEYIRHGLKDIASDKNADVKLLLSERILNIATISQLENVIIPAVLTIIQQPAENEPEKTRRCSLAKEIAFDLLSKCLEKISGNFNEDTVIPILMAYPMVDMTLLPLLTASVNVSSKKRKLVYSHLKSFMQDQSISTCSKTLAKLTKMRSDAAEIDDELFQTLYHRVNDANNRVLTQLRMTNDYDHCADLQVAHLSLAQVTEFFAITKRDSASKPNDHYIDALGKMALLPENIFPINERRETVKFLLMQLSKGSERIARATKAYVILNDIADVAHGKALNYISQFIFKKLGNARNPFTLLEHILLLEACTSLMTPDEIRRDILPHIKVAKLNSLGYRMLMSTVLMNVLTKLDDELMKDTFLEPLLKSFCEKVDIESCELEMYALSKTTEMERVVLVRRMMKEKMDGVGVGKMAFVFSQVYKLNKDAVGGMVEFCQGDKYGVAQDVSAQCMIM